MKNEEWKDLEEIITDCVRDGCGVAIWERKKEEEKQMVEWGNYEANTK